MTRKIAPIDSGAAEIDRIRNEYSRRAREVASDYYGWNRPVNRFFHAQTCADCIDALARHEMFPCDGMWMADIGCGVGNWLLEFAQWGAFSDQLAGIDLDENRIESARRKLPAAALHVGDARRLPWPAARFDAVSQFTVFTSILDPIVKRTIASEMLRVLKPGGVVLWYDFRYNNPRNPMVKGIEADEIRALFPDCRVDLERVTLAPPVARAVVPLSFIAALLLQKIPFLRTHYLGIIRKNIG